jgi:hypothetical protein
LELLANVSGCAEPVDSGDSHASRIDREATTAVEPLTFQGRDFRVHFDWGAPPDCDATAVADRALSNEVTLLLPSRVDSECVP